MLSQIYSVYKKQIGKVGSQWFRWNCIKFGICGCWLESCWGESLYRVSLSRTFYLPLGVGRKTSSYMNEGLLTGI